MTNLFKKFSETKGTVNRPILFLFLFAYMFFPCFVLFLFCFCSVLFSLCFGCLSVCFALNFFVYSRRIDYDRTLTLLTLAVSLRGCPCKNRLLDFRPKTEFLQIFRVRQLVHMINKKGNNLAFNAIFQYFWGQFQRTVQNR